MKHIFRTLILLAAATLAATSCRQEKISIQKASLSETIFHDDEGGHCLELEVSVQLPCGKKVSEAARRTIDEFIWSTACLEGSPEEGMSAEDFANAVAQSSRDEYLSSEVYQDEDNFEGKLFFTCGEVWNGILCYSFGTYIYIGGAHGGWIESYINVDLESGKKMELTDFVPEASFDALDELLTKHLDDLDGQVRESLWEDSVKHSKAFCVGRSGLSFHYGEYELGPYYLGTIDLTVPWDEIEKI